MSTSSITSGLLSQIAASSSQATQFVSDLGQLNSDLTNGDLSSAQQDFVTLSENALNGSTSDSSSTSSSGFTTDLLSKIAGSTSLSGNFVSELSQLGSDLSNYDLTSAQGDMLALSSTALNAANSTTSSNASSKPAALAGSGPTANEMTDIRAIMQAMQSGVSSVGNSAMAQLAADAQNTAGSNYFKLISQTTDSNSSSTSATSGTDSTTNINTLMQTIETSTSTVNALLQSGSLNTNV